MSGKCHPSGLAQRLQSAWQQGVGFLDWELARSQTEPPAPTASASSQQPQPRTEGMTIGQIHEKIQSLLTPLFSMRAPLPRPGPAQGLLLRLTCTLQDELLLPLLQWMHTQDTPQRFFWSDRERNIEWAGVGSAETHRIEHPAQTVGLMATLHQRLQGAPDNLRYIGGFRFSSHADMSPHWRPFGVSSWTLPFLGLTKEAGELRLDLHIHFAAGESIAQSTASAWQMWQATRWHEARERQPLSLQPLQICPSQEIWHQNIKQVQEAFATGPLDKVVLATEHTFQAERPTSAQVWSSWILALQETSHDTYLFYYQPDAQHAFLGATPERLFARAEQQISTEALAGTLPRGDTPGEDKALGELLLASTKDRREQEIITEDLLQRLEKCCLEVRHPGQPGLRKLHHIQHLWTEMAGTLKPNVDTYELLCDLHPTPAVGGRPRLLALQHITALEAFDRGWYAAPLGWISANQAEFAVAIRSGLLTPDTIRLYAGAGIVADSAPDKEWQELGYKLRPFLRLTRESA